MSEAGTSAVSGLLSTKTAAPVKGAGSSARSAEHLRGERSCRRVVGLNLAGRVIEKSRGTLVGRDGAGMLGRGF